MDLQWPVAREMGTGPGSSGRPEIVTEAAYRTGSRKMMYRVCTSAPTFIIDPLERDGLLPGNAAHRSHLVTQLHKGYLGSQVCDQHVPGCTHTENVKIESFGLSEAEIKRSLRGFKESTTK